MTNRKVYYANIIFDFFPVEYGVCSCKRNKTSKAKPENNISG